MNEKFKERLKAEGRSLKWFFDKFVSKQLKITYVYMTAQLNGFNTMTDELNQIISNYMENYGETV